VNSVPAVGRLGRQKDAIAELEALIELAGDLSERERLLGGRAEVSTQRRPVGERGLS
jgi:hypothetical protein